MFGTLTKEDLGFLIGDLVLCNAEDLDPTTAERIKEALDRVEELAPDKETGYAVVRQVEEAFLSLVDDYICASFMVGVMLAKDPLSLFEPIELARLKARLLKKREESTGASQEAA